MPCMELPEKWRGALISAVGALIAFSFGYFYAAQFPLQGTWAQSYMSPAVNYACTGRFGPLRLSQDAGPDDVAGLGQVEAFLAVRRPELSCDEFPRRVSPTSFFDGIEAANTEQPMYLMLSYAILWRAFGLDWSLTYGVLAAVFALSFLAIHFCLRPFVPAAVAAGAALIFLSSPLFVANILSPRDALKFPFAVVIGALLIGGATSRRRP